MAQRNFYEMHTAAGNRACERMVDRIRKRSDELDTHKKLYIAVRVAMDMLAVKYPEVYDSEPAGHVFDEAILPIAERHGFTHLCTRYL